MCQRKMFLFCEVSCCDLNLTFLETQLKEKRILHYNHGLSHEQMSSLKSDSRSFIRDNVFKNFTIRLAFLESRLSCQASF